MELSCSAVPSEAAHLTQSGTQRQRIRQACKQCHLLKAKCSGTTPACQRCCKKGIPCQYAVPKPPPKTRKRRRAIPLCEDIQASPLSPPLETPRKDYQRRSSSNVQSAISPTVNNTHTDPHHKNDYACKELGLEKTIIRLYIDAYFEYVAVLCENGFIHRALLLRAWTRGAVDPALLKAMCSASADYVPASMSASTRRESWLLEAESYIWSNIGRPSIAVLQVLVIVTSQKFALTRFLALQPLLGIAAKMAFMLRLNHENSKLSITAREIRRRIMWSIFILERRLAGGQVDLVTCTHNLMHIQLPSNVKDFELGISGRTGLLVSSDIDEESSNMGTRAYFCRLSSIRHEILQQVKPRVISENARADETRGDLIQLESDLLNLKTSLPPSLALNERNLSLRAYSPHMRRYFMLHAQWHQCHCDLYRFLIPGLRDSLPDEAFKQTSTEYATYCQLRAVTHAKSLVDLFQMAGKFGDEMLQDPGIKIFVYQCTRILIRAFDIGLLGTQSAALETIHKLKDAADNLTPLIAMDESTRQLYNGIQKLIRTAVARASDPDTMTPDSEAEQILDTNILDILARVQQNDLEKGEEVLQHYPQSPPVTATASSQLGPAGTEAGNDDNKASPAESPARREDFGDQSWYTGLETEEVLGSGSFTNILDEFGESMLELQFQDVEQLYDGYL
ncbi:unnamed protein product [Penicillium olsonii]|nr:unnamed protein product [Penicillium olsonii]